MNPHAQILKDAIEASQCVSVLYNETERHVEPHTLGKDAEGNFLVRVFQPNGYEASSPGWKLMRVDAIQRVTHVANPIPEPRPGYNPNDKAMKGGIEAAL